MARYTAVGIDLGKISDPTSICVVEATRPDPPTIYDPDVMMRTTAALPRAETHYTVRDLARLPLGTNYPQVYQTIVTIVDNLQRYTVHRPRVLVDATGAVAAVDSLRDALRGKNCTLVACTFTHGDRLAKGGSYAQPTLSVGKAFLVSRLQTLLQWDHLDLPARSPEVLAMRDELLNYEIRIDENANDKYGAFAVGTHDDLVTALGLAVLDDPIQEAQSRRLVIHGTRRYE